MVLQGPKQMTQDPGYMADALKCLTQILLSFFRVIQHYMCSCVSNDARQCSFRLFCSSLTDGSNLSEPFCHVATTYNMRSLFNAVKQIA